MSGVSGVSDLAIAAVENPAGSPSFGGPRRFFNSKKASPVAGAGAGSGAGGGSPGLSLEVLKPELKTALVVKPKEIAAVPIFLKALEENNLDQAFEMIPELEKLNIKFYLLPGFNRHVRELLELDTRDYLEPLLNKLVRDKPWSVEALRKILMTVLQETDIKSFHDEKKLKPVLKALNLLLMTPYYGPEIWLDTTLVREFKKYRRDSWRSLCRAFDYSGIEVFLDIEIYKPTPVQPAKTAQPLQSVKTDLSPQRLLSSATRFVCGNGSLPSQFWDAFPEKFKGGRCVEKVSEAKELLRTEGFGKMEFLDEIYKKMDFLKQETIQNLFIYARTSSAATGSENLESLERLKQIKVAKIKFKEVPSAVDFEQLLILKQFGNKNAMTLAIESGNSQVVLELLNLFDPESKWLRRIGLTDWMAIFFLGLKDKKLELTAGVFDKVAHVLPEHGEFKLHIEGLIQRKDREGLEFIHCFAPEFISPEIIETLILSRSSVSGRSDSGDSLAESGAESGAESAQDAFSSSSIFSQSSSSLPAFSPGALSPGALSPGALSPENGGAHSVLLSSGIRSTGGLVLSPSSFAFGPAALAGPGSTVQGFQVAGPDFGSDSGSDPDALDLAGLEMGF